MIDYLLNSENSKKSFTRYCKFEQPKNDINTNKSNDNNINNDKKNTDDNNSSFRRRD